MSDTAPTIQYEDDIDLIKRNTKKSEQKEDSKRLIPQFLEPVEPKSETAIPKTKEIESSVKEEGKDRQLKFGFTQDKKPVFISEKGRYANVLIIGVKNSGKSSIVLPMLARQDILNNDCGATFVVDKKDMAYTLYAMAKDAGRKVIILKPSANFDIANDFIHRAHYDYEYINSRVIDYKDAIKKKVIVIIDMEYAKYRQSAIRATAMLLMQLQIDMQDTQHTLKRPHFVYIDDSHRYLPFIELLLTSGDDYGIGNILFLQGRAQFNMYETDYSSLIDVNVRNTILMNGITYEDARYYSERFFDFTIADMLNRREGLLLYEIVDPKNTRTTGRCGLVYINESVRKSIEEKAKKARKQLNKFSKKAELKISIKEEEELDKFNKLRAEKFKVNPEKPFDTDENSRIVKEILKSEKDSHQALSDEPLETQYRAPRASEGIKQEIEEVVVEGIPRVDFIKDIVERIDASMIESLDEIAGLDGDILSELSKLNSEYDGLDDGMIAYEDENDDTEETEVVSIIEDVRRTLIEQEQEIIEITDTLTVDSAGDDYLRENRGYKPIRKHMPRKKKDMIAAEHYVNEMLNKKLK